MTADAYDPKITGYVEGFASRVYRRLSAAGCASLHREDVVQECWVAWCKARDGYDSGKGSNFGLYLFGTMTRHINRWADSHLRFSLSSVALDEPIHENLTIGDLIPDRAPTSDEIVGGAQLRNGIAVRLSVEARVVLGLLDNTPPWLAAELRALAAKVEWDKRRGFTPTPIPRRVTMTLLFTLFRFSALQRKSVRAELMALCDLVDSL